MVRTTKEQRKALKRVYDRYPAEAHKLMTYREYREMLQPTFGCDGAVVARFAGMWLCIEKDGYTHS